MSSTPPQPPSTVGGQHPRGGVATEPSTAAQQPSAQTSAELVADSVGGYLEAWWRRVRGGESGVLPVLAGLVIIIVIFQVERSVFLSAGNIVNLLEQGATFILLGMAEVFVLLLGEIDLSLGYVAGVGGVVTVGLASPQHHQAWWVAVLAGLGITTVIGVVQGLLITRLGLPSFVVTLAGLIGFNGLLLILVDQLGGAAGGGTIGISNHVLNDLVAGNIDPVTGWVAMAVLVALFAALTIWRDRRRRASGLVAPPFALTLAKIALLAAAGIALVVICNTNRGRFAPVRGVPWVVPIVLAVLVLWTFVLGRTRFGRYIYAIGGSAEGARRAGIRLSNIRLACFALAGLTAGIGGIIYASRLGSIGKNVDQSLVLYAIASAVIGGTSLFGGRGKMVHALLGGIVIATIYNGMGLIGLSAAAQYVVTGLVLLAAVIVDAVARRGQTVS